MTMARDNQSPIHFDHTGWSTPMFAAALLCLTTSACVIEEPADDEVGEAETGDGDGDGDMTTGDGDGDGDGDMTTGDGDGDGDGDMTTGDGDGDGDPSPAICPGSEAFCSEAESHCEQGLLQICQYSEEQDCIFHAEADCEAITGPGSMCVTNSPTSAGCSLASAAFIVPVMCDGAFIELAGDAYCSEDNGLKVGTSLTLPQMSSEGGAYFVEEMPVGHSFETKFSFEIRNPGGITDGDCGAGVDGGDGFAFVIHEEVLGGGGGGLGYAGVPGVVAIEFDTYCNEESDDPSSNHIGIMIDGNANHLGQPTVDIPGSFEDGSTWWSWIDYDGTTIRVFVANEDVKPAEPAVSGDVDVVGITGSGVRRVGFTSATGWAWENAIIKSWEFGGQGTK
jgi:hypothetical protein